jgi:hypothetical protein
MPVQMNSVLKPKNILVALLIMVFFALAYAAYDFPPDARNVFAVCLVAAGVLNILLRRSASRSIFRLLPQSKVWSFFGEEGVQFGYLAFGVTLVAEGLLLLLIGFLITHRS